MEHVLVDQRLVMGKKLAGRVSHRRASPLRVHPANNAHVRAVWPEPSPLHPEPLRYSVKAGLSCTGLQSWGIRRKVHFLARREESSHCLPLPEPVKADEEAPPPPTLITRATKRMRKPTEKVRGRKKLRPNDNPRSSSSGAVDRWSQKRYNWSELKLLDIMKERGAVLGNPILRHALRSEARKHIGDTGLLDHLLKHMVGKVYKERGERFCRRHNSDGAMEFWLESDDLVELRKQAGVSDPYWVPPPGWKPGSNPYQDDSALELKHLKQEMDNLKKILQQLLLKEQGNEEEGNSQSLIKPSQVACEPNNSLALTISLQKRKASHCDSIMKFRWTKERYEAAELKLLEIMKQKSAFLGNPILRGDLRTEARHHVGDTGLLDHLLKHMVGKVFGDKDERLCRHRNSEGAMEYWLENADMVELRRQAGVKDPYWVPPPGWQLGDNPYNYVESSSAINLLKLEIDNLKRDLLLLLLKKDGAEDGEYVETLVKGFKPVHESINSLEMRVSEQSHVILKNRWSKKRCGTAELKVLDIMREKEASIRRPMLRSALRLEAGKCIRSMPLVDYLLENMEGKVYEERSERFCCQYGTDGVVECWLESVDEVEHQGRTPMNQCGVQFLGKLNDHPPQIFDTSGEIELLKEEMHKMAMRLEQLLEYKNEGEVEHTGQSLACCSQSNSELTTSQEANLTSQSYSNSLSLWSNERYKAAELKLLDIMKERRAVLGNPILQPVLRLEALKHIGNTDLLDHLLKHMVGKVYKETGERLCQHKNSDGNIEYWLESSCLVELRRLSGVMDPCVVPTHNWKLREGTVLESTATGELQKVKEEMGQLKRHLDHLHPKELDSVVGENTLSLTRCFQTNKSNIMFEDSTPAEELKLDFPPVNPLLLEMGTGFNEWELEEISELL